MGGGIPRFDPTVYTGVCVVGVVDGIGGMVISTPARVINKKIGDYLQL